MRAPSRRDVDRVDARTGSRDHPRFGARAIRLAVDRVSLRTISA